MAKIQLILAESAGTVRSIQDATRYLGKLARRASSTKKPVDTLFTELAAVGDEDAFTVIGPAGSKTKKPAVPQYKEIKLNSLQIEKLKKEWGPLASLEEAVDEIESARTLWAVKFRGMHGVEKLMSELDKTRTQLTTQLNKARAAVSKLSTHATPESLRKFAPLLIRNLAKEIEFETSLVRFMSLPVWVKGTGAAPVAMSERRTPDELPPVAKKGRTSKATKATKPAAKPKPVSKNVPRMPNPPREPEKRHNIGHYDLASYMYVTLTDVTTQDGNVYKSYTIVISYQPQQDGSRTVNITTLQKPMLPGKFSPGKTPVELSRSQQLDRNSLVPILRRLRIIMDHDSIFVATRQALNNNVTFKLPPEVSKVRVKDDFYWVICKPTVGEDKLPAIHGKVLDMLQATFGVTKRRQFVVRAPRYNKKTKQYAFRIAVKSVSPEALGYTMTNNKIQELKDLLDLSDADVEALRQSMK